MVTSPLWGSEVRRSPPRARTYLVDCKVCHQWHSVATIEIQSICKEAGACPDCMRNDYFLLRVKIAALEMHLDELVKRGQKMPEGAGRDFMRKMYTKKLGQLTTARKQIATLEAL